MLKVMNDEKKVIISDDIKEKLEYILKNLHPMFHNLKQLENEISINLFYEKIDDIISSDISKFQLYKDDNIKLKSNIDEINNIIEQYNQMLPKENRTYENIYSLNEESLVKIIDIIYKICNEKNKCFLIRDLINAKNDCIKNMRYFVNENDILRFERIYDEAIKNKDVEKMKLILSKVQEATLREWENYFQNLDNMNDDNFAFIGHSTSSVQFKGDFFSTYISTSLFNQDLTDTYRSGFGFIFAPKGIKGANSNDMYVNNYVTDDNRLLNYSSIPIINHPQRLIEECLKLKQQNIDNNNDKKVYNEVIIEGFEPIGIFCFTDGSKMLDQNYRNARELQKNFPHLKIYTFDVMKRKKGFQLEKMKLNLIDNLNFKLFRITKNATKDELPMYDYFFEEFEKLKQKGNYDESQIEQIFKENDRLLSIFDKEPEVLFSGAYDDRKIKYILGKNVKYNIEYILSGKARAFLLNNLKILYPYKDKLNKYYDGLSELVELVSKIEVTDEMMKQINSEDNLNLYVISKCIAKTLMRKVDLRMSEGKEKLRSYQVDYKKLLSEYKRRIHIENKYKYFSRIYEKRFYEDIIIDDYNRLLNDINELETKCNNLNDQLNRIEKEIEELNKKNSLIMNLSYDEHKLHKDSLQAIDKINLELSNLRKHPLINSKKIKQLEEKIKEIRINDNIVRDKFERRKIDICTENDSKRDSLEFRRSFLERELNYCNSEIERYQQQLIYIKKQMKEYFNCDSIEQIHLAIEEATNFIKNEYDLHNHFYLDDLKERIDKLKKLFQKQKEEIGHIQRERESISKVV